MKINILIILFFLIFSKICFAENYQIYCSYEEAQAACSGRCFGRTPPILPCNGISYYSVKNLDTGFFYIYPTSSCPDNPDSFESFCSNLNSNPTECSPFMQCGVYSCCTDETCLPSFSASSSGPGAFDLFVQGSASGGLTINDVTQYNWTGTEQDCGATATLTANPNLAGVSADIQCSGDCSVSGNSATCILGENPANCSVIFSDLCTADSDGDSIPDYVDNEPDKENPLTLSFGISAGIVDVSADVNIEELIKYLWDFSGEGIDWMGEKVQNAIKYLRYNGSDGSVIEYGNKDADGIRIGCDPRFEYCPQIPASLLSKLIPCNSDNVPKWKELLEVPKDDLPDPRNIPDGIYGDDNPVSGCECFDTVNKNTAATVDQLKDLYLLNTVIKDNVKSIVANTGETKKAIDTAADRIVEQLKKTNSGSVFQDNDDFTEDDADKVGEKVLQHLKDDADDLDGEADDYDIALDLENDLNDALFNEDDKKNMDELAENAKTSYKDKLTAFNTQLMTDFRNRFKITSTGEQCSFTAPIFNSQTVNFDMCGYSDHLDRMGIFLKFLSYISAVLIILKA